MNAFAFILDTACTNATTVYKEIKYNTRSTFDLFDS